MDNLSMALLKEIEKVCSLELGEMLGTENRYFAKVNGNDPCYQYFFHGGPNHIWKEYPQVRELLRRQRQILLPDFETFMELQRVFALSRRSRKLFLAAQRSSEEYPNLNPTDDDLLLYFVTTWGGVWFAKHFTYPGRILIVLHEESPYQQVGKDRS